jgi:hypothetical protein
MPAEYIDRLRLHMDQAGIYPKSVHINVHRFEGSLKFILSFKYVALRPSTVHEYFAKWACIITDRTSTTLAIPHAADGLIQITASKRDHSPTSPPLG